jgi:DNA-binding MarR family transcriptional regulator
MDVGPGYAGLGTLMRHVLDLMEGDVAKVYEDAGVREYRPRFSPVVRVLVANGPMSIGDIARAVRVTHSAASQTVNQMSRSGLVTLEPGVDARRRIVELTDRCRSLLPTIEAEWAATAAAVTALDAELPLPLSDVLTAAVRALEKRPFAQRIADSARGPAPLDHPVPPVG